MWRLLTLLVGLTMGWQANAQSVSLSESEAQAKIDELAKNYTICGVVMPLGEFSFMTVEVAEGMSRREQWLTISALKDAGAINIVDLPTMLGSVHFRVEVRSDIDPSKLTQIGRSKCLVSNTAAGTGKVVKIDLVKGGTTRWDGAVIYYTVTNRNLSDLYVSYLAARKEAWKAGDLRIRALWRYDPFKGGWNRTQYVDSGPLNGAFMSQKVTDGLRSD